jgi:transaldolase
MNTPLISMSTEQGQSPWIDNLKRSYVTDGTLQTLVDRGVRGVTSNPSIFQKAISGSKDYDAAFSALIKGGASIEEAYWELVIEDVTNACRLMRPVYETSHGTDGYVSLEVSPALAHDTAGTERDARSLAARVAEPNVMIKIPATKAGVPAIRKMIAEGYDINVTLIFSLDRYADVMEAYISGLEDRLAAGATDLSGVASVASFFISRVDAEVEKRIAFSGKGADLIGKPAVSQGVLAYQLFLNRFSGPRWERLVAHGARVQRPLWASTSTKNSAFPDTLYVDTLIGPSTVNTLPEPTLEAFADHGVSARTVDSLEAIASAHAVWGSLASNGIDMDDVAEVLEREGVASFAKAFDELLQTLSTRANELR